VKHEKWTEKWWFHFLFSIIYGIIIPNDFHIFQDAYGTTNQFNEFTPGLQWDLMGLYGIPWDSMGLNWLMYEQ